MGAEVLLFKLWFFLGLLIHEKIMSCAHLEYYLLAFLLLGRYLGNNYMIFRILAAPCLVSPCLGHTHTHVERRTAVHLRPWEASADLG